MAKIIRLTKAEKKKLTKEERAEIREHNRKICKYINEAKLRNELGEEYWMYARTNPFLKRLRKGEMYDIMRLDG